MIEHVFPPEMMQERERQLVMALLDCAGVYYDINFSQDRILGTPIQVVDGVAYPILELIGKPKNCTYTEILDYWAERMPENEVEAFLKFSDIARIQACYEAGRQEVAHTFWTYDVLGNPMLAEQKIRLYQNTEGELLGLAYVSNGREREDMQVKEAALLARYEQATNRAAFLEAMGANVPGGYHRCGTGGGFPLEFVSDSFLEIVGWSREELAAEMDNKFFNLVAPEDKELFLAHEPALVANGRVDVAYRIIRKDGTRRWVQDSTLHVEKDGREYYQCTLADITDLVEGLVEARQRAEASSQAKSTFLFNASHDIRTPMNAIQGFSRIIAENADDPVVVRKTIQKIQDTSKTLMNLLNDVLDLARIERGKDEVEKQPLDLEAHCQKLYEMFAGEMAQAGLTFREEHDIRHPHVLGDDLKLTRIAMNLLSNAKKFTPQGGRVVFSVRESDYNGKTAVYSLSVRDTGIGMSKEFQSRAFEQFERERTSTDTGIIGSGLGLAIIKKICDLLGGTCTIDSELGKGSEITVRVPLTVADEQSYQAKPAVTVNDFSGKRALLVEDNAFNREIARYLLESVRFQVEEAENGSVCVDKLLKAGAGYYDVVLMDVQMPVMDGYTATKEIRHIGDPGLAAIPIIAMTANAFDEDRRKCLEVGMNGHVGKPVEMEKLLEALNGI